MPVYNCRQFVAAAIESVLNQTYANFELIIIDDCSSDNTLGVISSYTDKRIRLISKKENKGLIDSLNLGIALSAGKYLARMDGDDICAANRFATQLNFMELNPDVTVCGTWYRDIATGEIVK